MSNTNIAQWEDYSYKVQMLINSPKNSGLITQDEVRELGGNLFIYEYGSEEIGEKITFYWVVDDSDDAILLSRFTLFGSPAGIAANDMLALLCRNKTVDKASEITYKGLEYFLRDNPSTPALPQSVNYTISMALDGLRNACMEYFNDKEKNASDEITISTDSPMSLKAIKNTIKLHDLHTVEEVIDYTKVGFYDKAVIEPSTIYDTKSYYLSSILKEAREEIDKEKQEKKIELDSPFRELDTAGQIEAINKAIDDSGVRQYLIMDGGDMEILDVKENEAHLDIYIRYLGACNGCASSTTGTLFAIETTLKERLDEQIRVLPI